MAGNFYYGVVVELRRFFNRCHADLNLGNGIETGCGSPNCARLMNGEIQPRDLMPAAIDKVDAADVLLGGGPVRGAMDSSGDTHLGKICVVFVEDALDLTHGNRVECQK